MTMRHQKLALADEFAVFLSLDGTHGNGTAFVHIEAVGLSCVHLGVSRAITYQRTLADLRVMRPGMRKVTLMLSYSSSNDS